jgi:hypothetical protein
VHYGASVPRSVDTLFSCSGGTGTDSTNSAFSCDQAMKISMHYFSRSGGTGMDSTNIAVRHVTMNLYFSIRCDLRVTKCILVRLRYEMSTQYFSCSGGPGVVSTKSAPRHVQTRLHYVTRRSHRMQKHMFGVMCPGVLFDDAASGPPEHEK